MVDILRMHAINKRFGQTQALHDVDFSLAKGEIHALVGENGAGKSSLMKILAGVYSADSGMMYVDKRLVKLRNVADARRQGIVMVHQELALVPAMRVAENLFLGNLPAWLPGSSLFTRAKTLLDTVGLELDPREKLENLSLGQQQLVEIAAALAKQGRILILDEPTAALSVAESAQLFRLMRTLRDDGVSIIYISHRLEEIFQVCDRVTVLRDGKWVATESLATLRPERVVELMVGKRVRHYQRHSSRQDTSVGHLVLQAPGLAETHVQLQAGEIVGMAGVLGSGRSRMLSIVFGLEGRATWDGVPIASPAQAIQRGIALVPADRKKQGLLLGRDLCRNLTLATLRQLQRGGFIREADELAQSRQWMATLALRPADPYKIMREFSGGNQQKAVLGKALATEPRVLLLDEPTRGVDIGARNDIYNLLDDLAKQGMALLVASSDTEELIGLADRILVFRNGSISVELTAPFNIQEVVAHVTGAHQLA